MHIYHTQDQLSKLMNRAFRYLDTAVCTMIVTTGIEVCPRRYLICRFLTLFL